MKINAERMDGCSKLTLVSKDDAKVSDLDGWRQKRGRKKLNVLLFFEFAELA